MISGHRSGTLFPLSTYEENLIKHLTEAIAAATIAANGLRYAVSGLGNQSGNSVTRCDLASAEARITATIVGHQRDMEALAALAIRAQRISSKLKALSGKFTQLDSATDSSKTAP